MKVLYLFNRVREGLVDKVKKGESHDNHFYGMLRLRQYGVEADYIEIEQYLPKALCDFLRKRVLNIYFVHLPLFFKMLRYDAVFTSTAFGSQLLHALYPFKKPRWVMFDFSIMGLLGEEKTLRQRVFRWMVRRADGIVAISRDEESRLQRRFPEMKERIRFIPLGSDLEFFKPRNSGEENKVFTVGFDPGRDYKTFFEACGGIDVSVVIATKPYKVAKLKLPSNFSAREFSPVDIVREYDTAKVVVLPLDIRGGINEAMGCSSLVEAMAMGKPVVATRTPTMESYIENGVNGILVPPHDASALRSAVLSLLDDGERRKKMGLAAREFILKRCAADDVARELASFFKLIARSAR
ncbi:MAG: glycosyltransferase family 4 protein [Candidatus Taylorbacteria bacterium]|nr:glycosyltransferase family 4 protein [Candidatus Taylorbacteria bacterium]